MDEELLRRAYGALNARNVDAALSLMQPAVRWANGADGGFVRGRGGLREYWARQWKQVDSRLEPLSFRPGADGRVRVKLHQRVLDRDGTVTSEATLEHVFTFRAGLIDALEPAQTSGQ